jgi:hypothetical protein
MASTTLLPTCPSIAAAMRSSILGSVRRPTDTHCRQPSQAYFCVLCVAPHLQHTGINMDIIIAVEADVGGSSGEERGDGGTTAEGAIGLLAHLK